MNALPRLTLCTSLEQGAIIHHRFVTDAVVIGRDAHCDLILDAEDVSRRHLVLRRTDGSWWAEDLGSRNGTTLNGRPLVRETVRDGDELRLGRARIRVAFESASSKGRLETEEPATEAACSAFIGTSEVIAKLNRVLRKAAPHDTTMLLHGEPGVGKELAARMLHECSGRTGALRVVNCPAIPEALFASELFGIAAGTATGVSAREGLAWGARGGTLFFDEIGVLPRIMQPQLLRFLESHVITRVGSREEEVVDVRVVAATNRDLEDASARGEFLPDLLDRLRMGSLLLPPLRDHREDIPALVDLFLRRSRPTPSGITAEAITELRMRPMPGNVRELRETILHAAVAAEGGCIAAEHLPPPPRARVVAPAEALRERLLRREADFWVSVREPFLARELPRDDARRLIATLYAECGSSYKRMAERLGIEAQHKKLLNFLRDHGLRPDD